MEISNSGLTISSGCKVIPGEKIGKAIQVIPGRGSYIRGSNIYASAAGTLVVDEKVQADKIWSEVSVKLEGKRSYASSYVLSIGNKVLCKVVRITNQMATVEIVAAEEIGSLREHHEGIIRKEDVRTAATEDIDIYECFRPGDVVVAKIISLGTSRRYFLTTAETELGVLRATCSTSREIMVPISYKEMECPISSAREKRKCAKPS